MTPTINWSLHMPATCPRSVQLYLRLRQLLYTDGEPNSNWPSLGSLRRTPFKVFPQRSR